MYAGKAPDTTVRLRRLAAELRALRASAGLTQDEVAERTGINAATLYRIEHARVRPQTRTLRTLLSFYAVDWRLQDDLDVARMLCDVRGWSQAQHAAWLEA
jgi:transcriptional regulator with XRE-family HTH domain